MLREEAEFEKEIAPYGRGKDRYLDRIGESKAIKYLDALDSMPHSENGNVKVAILQFSLKSNMLRINRLCLETMCQPEILSILYEEQGDLFMMISIDFKRRGDIIIPSEYYAQEFDWFRWKDSDVAYPFFEVKARIASDKVIEKNGWDRQGSYQLSGGYDKSSNWTMFHFPSAIQIEEF
jgi:hypothetical protein